jgi:NADH-ubiquinone oxidoreductase chain 5
LPAAIAAPTPVSSLVHSSTLVTAGVFVMLRFRYLFYKSILIITVVRLTTIFLAGLAAFVESDLKKLVAMSTLRQLGLMTFSLSIGL